MMRDFDDATRDYWRGKTDELKKSAYGSFVGFDYDFEHGSWYDLTPEQRYQVMMRTPQMSALSRKLSAWQQTSQFPDDIRLVIDIDPMTLS